MPDLRWGDPREHDAREPGDEWPRTYDDPRDRDDDPRDALIRDLDLPRGDERELVVDRDRIYELWCSAADRSTESFEGLTAKSRRRMLASSR